MKARVRVVDELTVDYGGHKDTFVMVEMMGKTISVEPARDPETGKRWSNWYEGSDGYNYHKSWLTFLTTKKPGKGAKK